MQPYADAEGHIFLQPGNYRQQYKCETESETDMLRRVEEATSMLATVQLVFDKVRNSLSSLCASCPVTLHLPVTLASVYRQFS